MINPFISDEPEKLNIEANRDNEQEPNQLRRGMLKVAFLSPFINPSEVAKQLASSDTSEGLSSINGVSKIGIVEQDGSVNTEYETIFNAAELSSAIDPNPYGEVYDPKNELWNYVPLGLNLAAVWSMKGPDVLDPSKENTQDNAVEISEKVLAPLIESIRDVLQTWSPNIDNRTFVIYINRHDPESLALTSVHPDYEAEYNQWACNETGPKLGSFIVLNAGSQIFEELLSGGDSSQLLELTNPLMLHELFHVYMYKEGVDQRDMYNTAREQLATSLTYSVQRIYNDEYLDPHARYFATYRTFFTQIPSPDWDGDLVLEHTREFSPVIVHAFDIVQRQNGAITWDLFYKQILSNLNNEIPCSISGDNVADFAYNAVEITLRDFGVGVDEVFDMFDLEVHTVAKMMQKAIFAKEDRDKNDIYYQFGLRLQQHLQHAQLNTGENNITTTSIEPNSRIKSDVDTVRIVLPKSGKATLKAIDSDKIHQYYVITDTDVIFINPESDVELSQFAVEENDEKVVYVIAGRISGYQEDITLDITVEEEEEEEPQATHSGLVMPFFIKVLTPEEYAQQFASSVTGASARGKTQQQFRRMQFPAPTKLSETRRSYGFYNDT